MKHISNRNAVLLKLKVGCCAVQHVQVGQHLQLVTASQQEQQHTGRVWIWKVKCYMAGWHKHTKCPWLNLMIPLAVVAILCWLPEKCRIGFKVLLLTYKAHHILKSL